MDIRLLDLDGSLLCQRELLTRYQPRIFSARDWAPSVRMACSFRRYRRFERNLATLLGGPVDDTSWITFIGSGDFHHVSLAFLRRQPLPCNVLILDNHPDWMRGVPFMHCGTWVYHAARLPFVQRIFHVGGDVDFDNYYQGMTPWRLLRSGRIRVLPARRQFTRSAWSAVANEPVRPAPDTPATAERVSQLLLPHHDELARLPLYISLDKDVMPARDAAVNWDSGHLTLAEVQAILSAFRRLSNGRLSGMDVVGDWSPVRLHGWLRRLMHWTEHPALTIAQDSAAPLNEQTNLALLASLPATAEKSFCPGGAGVHSQGRESLEEDRFRSLAPAPASTYRDGHDVRGPS
jgi:hypothetical protein